MSDLKKNLLICLCIFLFIYGFMVGLNRQPYNILEWGKEEGLIIWSIIIGAILTVFVPYLSNKLNN